MSSSIFNLLSNVFNQVVNKLMEIQFFEIPLLTILLSMMIASIIVGVFHAFSR